MFFPQWLKQTVEEEDFLTRAFPVDSDIWMATPLKKSFTKATQAVFNQSINQIKLVTLHIHAHTDGYAFAWQFGDSSSCLSTG